MSKMTERIVLPLPELLPRGRAEFREAARLMAAAGLEVDLLSGPGQDLRRARGKITALYEGSLVELLLHPAGRGWSAPAREQDRFFGVVRATGDAGGILLGGVLLSYVEAVEHSRATGCSLSEQDWRDLFRGPTEMIRFSSGRALSADGPTPEQPRTGTGNGEERPGIRWEVGHRLFFSLTQSITTALSCFAAATARRDEAESADSLELATSLMTAAAAALRFTADFSPAHYENDVRPSMMPPHVEPGFSGVQGRDHQVLVEVLRALRPVFGSIDRARYPYDSFKSAAERLFAAHEFVCAKFGGETKPSLLMEAHHKDGSSTSAAAAVVRQMSERRMALIHPHRPSREQHSPGARGGADEPSEPISASGPDGGRSRRRVGDSEDRGGVGGGAPPT
ncbi:MULTISPECIES: hypothetical protein [Kitasatospora]|nr:MULTISPECIES: hypothetical protein [Kitasatospora]